MQNIVQVDSFSTGQEGLNSRLAKGWVTLGTSTDETGYTRIIIGKPASVYIEELKSIIADYERLGLKEKLFESIASENGESLEEATASVYFGYSKTRSYIDKYEKLTK